MVEGTTKPRSANKPRRAKPVLFVEVGAQLRVVRLGSVPSIIGRGDAADVTIDNDGLSREHAKFVAAANGDVTVVDLESTNGTFIGHRRIEHAQLIAGTTVLLGPDVRATLRYPDPTQGTAIERLTARQLEIARLVAAGQTSVEIGVALDLSARTVDAHVARIVKRLDCKGRTGLTQRITSEGLLPT